MKKTSTEEFSVTFTQPQAVAMRALCALVILRGQPTSAPLLAALAEHLLCSNPGQEMCGPVDWELSDLREAIARVLRDD